MRKITLYVLASFLLLTGCTTTHQPKKTETTTINITEKQTTKPSDSFTKRLKENHITISSSNHKIYESLPFYIDLIGEEEVKKFSGTFTLLSGQAHIAYGSLDQIKAEHSLIMYDSPITIDTHDLMGHLNPEDNILAIVIRSFSGDAIISYDLSMQ